MRDPTILGPHEVPLIFSNSHIGTRAEGLYKEEGKPTEMLGCSHAALLGRLRHRLKAIVGTKAGVVLCVQMAPQLPEQEPFL